MFHHFNTQCTCTRVLCAQLKSTFNRLKELVLHNIMVFRHLLCMLYCLYCRSVIIFIFGYKFIQVLTRFQWLFSHLKLLPLSAVSASSLPREYVIIMCVCLVNRRAYHEQVLVQNSTKLTDCLYVHVHGVVWV